MDVHRTFFNISVKIHVFAQIFSGRTLTQTTSISTKVPTIDSQYLEVLYVVITSSTGLCSLRYGQL